jgi:hypothetical protein
MHHRDHERVRKHATEEVEKRSNSKNTWRLILIYRQLLKSKNPTTNLIGSNRPTKSYRIPTLGIRMSVRNPDSDRIFMRSRRIASPG